MRRFLKTLNLWLSEAGFNAAKTYLMLLALFALIGFPIVCLGCLIYLAICLAELVDPGPLSISIFLGVPALGIAFFLRFMHRVIEPVTSQVFKTITEGISRSWSRQV